MNFAEFLTLIKPPITWWKEVGLWYCSGCSLKMDKFEMENHWPNNCSLSKLKKSQKLRASILEANQKLLRLEPQNIAFKGVELVWYKKQIENNSKLPIDLDYSSRIQSSTKNDQALNILNFIKSEIIETEKYFIIPVSCAVGVFFVNRNNPTFISGQLRMQAVKGGLYPVNYLRMINEVFGYELNTIEVCSNSVDKKNAYTVDINPDRNPACVDNGEILQKIQSNFFGRWRCDPPYNEKTAKEMYNTSLPDVGKLLKTACRVCREGALLFLLLGPVNRQACPTGIKRIGWIPISVIPSNELRCLHIYLKISTCNVSLDPRILQEKSIEEVIEKYEQTKY